jgi:hypothetical protein
MSLWAGSRCCDVKGRAVEAAVPHCRCCCCCRRCHCRCCIKSHLASAVSARWLCTCAPGFGSVAAAAVAAAISAAAMNTHAAYLLCLRVVCRCPPGLRWCFQARSAIAAAGICLVCAAATAATAAATATATTAALKCRTDQQCCVCWVSALAVPTWSLLQLLLMLLPLPLPHEVACCVCSAHLVFTGVEGEVAYVERAGLVQLLKVLVLQAAAVSSYVVELCLQKHSQDKRSMCWTSPAAQNTRPRSIKISSSSSSTRCGA